MQKLALCYLALFQNGGKNKAGETVITEEKEKKGRKKKKRSQASTPFVSQDSDST